jgi:hypothetical protein
LLDLAHAFSSINFKIKNDLPRILIEEASLCGLLKTLLIEVGVTTTVTDPESFISQGNSNILL